MKGRCKAEGRPLNSMGKSPTGSKKRMEEETLVVSEVLLEGEGMTGLEGYAVGRLHKGSCIHITVGEAGA